MLRWRCGYLSGFGPAAGVSKKAEGKDTGEQIVPARVFYLFYLRLVLLPHQLVKRGPSSSWWAERNEVGRSGRGFPSAPALSCF